MRPSPDTSSNLLVARAASEDLDQSSNQVVSLGNPVPLATEVIRSELVEPVQDVHGSTAHDSTSDATCVGPGLVCSPADFIDVFRRDVESLFNRDNAIILSVAGGISFAFHETLDDDIADSTARNPNRWGEIQDVIGGIGNPLHHLALASGMYTYSLLTVDEELNDVSRSLFNATAITTISSTLLKFAANTRRPNGDPHGWPSGHTASSVAFAAVLDEYYGHCVGIPAFALSGLVAWERIDDREHDLSDVVFGAALGYVIGRTVSSQHRARFCGFEIEPYVDAATGTNGLGLERHF